MYMMPPLGALVAILTLTVAAPPATAQSRPGLQNAYKHIARHPNFAANYAQWRRQYPAFDWATDGCSAPAGATGYADDFHLPCVQHDFAYRNNRLVGLHTDNARQSADDVLRRATRGICSRRTGLDRSNCYRASDVFYGALRTFGGNYW